MSDPMAPEVASANDSRSTFIFLLGGLLENRGYVYFLTVTKILYIMQKYSIREGTKMGATERK